MDETSSITYCGVCKREWPCNIDHYSYPYPDLTYEQACSQASLKLSLTVSKFLQHFKNAAILGEDNKRIWDELVQAEKEESEIVSSY